MVHPPVAEEAAPALNGPDPAPVRWAAWREWKRRCALGLCGAPARALLTAFAAARFRKYLTAYAARTAPGAAERSVGPAEAWHLFETHLRTTRTAEGKAYKSWLFARVRSGAAAGAAVDTVQGGASTIVRTAVRRHMARELPDRRTVSLNGPIASSDGFSLQDVLPGGLPDPSEEAAGLELDRIAAGEALRHYDGMTARERLVTAARAHEWPLSHPAVMRAAGCRKTVLSDAYAALVRRVADRIRMDFRDEDPGVAHALAARTLAHLHRLAREQNPEMRAARGFLKAGGPVRGPSAAARRGSIR